MGRESLLTAPAQQCRPGGLWERGFRAPVLMAGWRGNMVANQEVALGAGMGTLVVQHQIKHNVNIVANSSLDPFA